MAAGEASHVIFQGQHSATDPHDLEPGQAEVQVNCWSPRTGELVVRGGMRKMESDDE